MPHESHDYHPKITIEPVTDPQDLPILAHLFDEALKISDPFYKIFNLYAPSSIYDSALAALSSALHDPSQHVFKAVAEEIDDSGNARRVIVGVSCWMVGYISIPKVDPFAEAANQVAENTVVPGTGDVVPLPDARDVGKKAFEVVFVEGWNAYIESIRGKKHIQLRRLAVSPSYQGRGIATELLRWGVDLADAQGIQGWVFASPAGYKLYERAGWRPVQVSEFRIPGIDTASVVAMLRKPDPLRKQGV